MMEWFNKLTLFILLKYIIAYLLKAEKDKILTPTAYKNKQGVKTPHTQPENPYRWHESTIVNILERKEYIGATVNFKTYTNSIWDKKQRENPEENRVIFYNTHPAIIEQEVFDKVQEIRQQRHRRTATGKSSPFSGLVFCADSVSYTHLNQGRQRKQLGN